MRDKNPKDVEAVSKDKSWNSNTADARLGFINRDSIVAEHLPAPMVVYPLGRLYQPSMKAGNAPNQQVSSMAVWTDARTTQVNNASLPGIMTFQFDPIFGQGRRSAADTLFGTADIYINKWTQLRILNNMTENFQPGDLQAVTAQLMNIKMHVENIRRALRVMQATTMSSTSAFHSPEAIIAALGWHMNESDMRTNFYRWRDLFNRSIVGNLNNVVWIKDIVPGFNRWESLVSEIYKDTSADTDYCQLMMLRPANLWTMHMTLASDGTHEWTFAKFEPGLAPGSDPWEAEPDSSAAGYYDSAIATKRFETYLGLVAQMIRDTFYDSSVMNILATLNAIEERKMSSQISVYRENIPYLDIEPEPIHFTWDFKMMLALHNASILDVECSSAVIDGKTGLMDQTLTVNLSSGSRNTAILNGVYGAEAGRALNLPCFGATNADFANATQWTVAPRRRPQSGDWDIPWDCVGTEVIRSAFVWHFVPNDQGGTQGVHINGYYFTQNVPLNTLAVAELDSKPELFETMAEAPAFAFAPLLYGIRVVDNQGTKIVSRIIGQSEVLYAPTADIIKRIHEEWVYNFWGFPVDVAHIGSPQFEAAN